MAEAVIFQPSSKVWTVGALCHAIADAMESKFNPVVVSGELSGFSRATSGHCYFNLKDANGQLRCAMFRRSASLIDFEPSEGNLVEVRGRLGVYEPRGDLQLIVDKLRLAGKGNLFEQFLKLKNKLEEEGLFLRERKRVLPSWPRGIGVVTSLGAAAWQDVVSALERRIPHISVFLAPAMVQGAEAPQAMIKALKELYQRVNSIKDPVDVILIVRGGGSLEDLWAFNDEALVRTLASSPVPVISGVGHESDFTLTDFVVDVRAPTPTAAAELVSLTQEQLLESLNVIENRLHSLVHRQLDLRSQRLDINGSRLGRPSALANSQRLRLIADGQRFHHASQLTIQQYKNQLNQLCTSWPDRTQNQLKRHRQILDHAQLRLNSLDPSLVLQRGYAILTDIKGKVVIHVEQVNKGDVLHATLVDGTVELRAGDLV